MALLEIEDLYVSYARIRALKGVSIKIQKGECASLIGPNGAGKSTLLNTISGLTSQWRGKILFNGVDLSRLTPAETVEKGLIHCPERRHVFPFMTVRDNLLMGAYNRRARKSIKENMELVFSFFPVLRERQNYLVRTLSGGQLQMVAIGRAILSKPRLLMLDEPMLGVAPILRGEFGKALEKLQRKKISVLVTEQEIALTKTNAEMVYVIVGGKIIAKETPDELRNKRDLTVLYFGETML